MIVLDKYQTQLVTSTSRYVFAQSGPQSGKTFGCMAANYHRAELIMQWFFKMKAQRKIDDKLYPEFFIAAPTENFLYSKTMEKFRETLPDNVTFKYTENKQFAVLSNNMKFRMVTFSKPNNVESFSSYGGLVDEAGQGGDWLFKSFKKRLRVRREQVLSYFRNDSDNMIAKIVGWIYFPTHPYDYNWLYTDINKPILEQGKFIPGVEIISWPVTDTPYYDKDDYEEAKKTLSAEEFAMMWEGKYIRPSIMVYVFSQDEVVVEDLPPRGEFNEFIIGLDFGSAHPCAISVVGITHSGDYYIVDEFREKNLPVITASPDSYLPSLYSKLKKFVDEYNVKYIYADSARPDLIKTLKTSRIKTNGDTLPGLPVRAADKFEGAKKSGIDMIYGLFKQKKIFIHRSCTKHLEELRGLRRVVDKFGEVSDQVEKKKDDLADALRYAIYTHKISLKDNPVSNYFTPLTLDQAKQIKIDATTPYNVFNSNNYDRYNNSDSWYID